MNSIRCTLLATFYLSLILVSASVCGQNKTEKHNTINYPRPLSKNDLRGVYPIKLLELAISKLETPYDLKASKAPMPQERALKTLRNRDGIDVVWTMTSNERENQLLPIRIPLYKGLIGWRLFLIKADNQVKFNSITNLAGLSQLIAGQGHDWPDTYIFNESGISVVSSPYYEGLFEMLAKNRFDYFPRSIVEIWGELDVRPELNLVVEKYILLRYPTAIYFFVNINDQQLANDIERGLNIAIEDGTFDSLFLEYNNDAINKASLSQRTIIDLPNPLLPPLTPLNNEALWFSQPL